MARPKNFRDLIVWQKAMALARDVYKASSALPQRESYGLASQIRRAALSIPSNIAEGHGRLTDLQFRHFLGNARGSLFELQTQLELAANLSYFDTKQARNLMDQSTEVARLINGLLSSMKRNRNAVEASSAGSANTAISALVGDQ
jgi:S23 ribosomal protein.